MLRLPSILFLFAAISVFGNHLRAQAPSPPSTGARSIQMFQGKSQNVWIAVYPPKTYANGAPIKPGTPVSIRVRRSFDNGKSFESRVTVVSGGRGFVGQGKAGSKKKPWIDLKLKVPVDNQKPYRVVLGVTAVVGKEESALNTSNLTFQYYPSLKIFPSPPEAENGKGIKTGHGSGPLHGTWNLDGQGTLTLQEKGRSVSGTITTQGQQIATLSGTRNGNQYNLAVTLTFEGKKYDAMVNLTVASNGKDLSGTARANGDSIPLKLKIKGRSLVAS